MTITFQDLILRLQRYWLDQGCVMWLPHHEMVGAGTNNPATILRVLGPEPLRIVYTEPSFRPDDGRYAENPNRVQMHHQLQVIIKPIPFGIQQMYLDSLFALGLDYRQHDIRFVEDNWESPVIGAWGLGWEVWLDGMEISQYTYFQQAGGLPLSPAACELTYGLERIAMYLQGVDSLWDLRWNEHFTYAELLRAQEIEYCRYNFETASIERCLEMFDRSEAEAITALDAGLTTPAYDYICRCSHLFNILDTRGAVGIAERAQFFGRIRSLSRRAAEAYVQQRESLGFPLVSLTPTDWQQPPAPGETCHITEAAGTFVCELGFEEVAAFVPERLVSQVHEALPALLASARLPYASFRVRVTPRRLAIIIEQLAARQQAAQRVVRGPRKDVCDKNPAALEGFCRRNGVNLEAVRWEEENGVTCATLTIEEPVASVAEVLPDVLTTLFDGLNCGRHMRWLPEEEGAKKVAFNRPIRSLVTLFNDQVIPWTYACVSSSRHTYGTRWQNSPTIRIDSATSYEATLLSYHVVLNQETRYQQILSQIDERAASVGGTVQKKADLVSEIVALTETPVAFVGSLPEIARDLPPIVIEAVIEKHVRCFTLRDSQGSPLPFFIGVSNGVADSIDVVSQGFARVIAARLKDAHFFISRDHERPLASYREGLVSQTFHEKLGSLLDKTIRVEKLVAPAADELQLTPDETKTLARAAHLSCADLATSMVTEMTSLQGEMGRLYALRDGEAPAVATALFEQYLPRHGGDVCPESRVGQALSILRRIDTISAFLAIGLEPSGSADPFALRREALGLLHSVLAFGHPLSLARLGEASLRGLAAQGVVFDSTATIARLLDFLGKRLEGIFREEGAPHDVVRAVLAVHGANPIRARQVVTELTAILRESSFRELLPSYLRCVRLLQKAQEDGEVIDRDAAEAVLTLPAERDLIRAMKGVAIAPSFQATLASFSSAAPAITTFFDTVLVMAPEPALRAARLGVIAKIAEVFTPFARLELLEG